MPGPPSQQPATATTPDGPPANPPPDLLSRPEPPPQVEPIRSGGPNKPYEVLGQRYTPLATDTALAQAGLASWYGRRFHGRPTASGEIYDMYALSAAHRTMPIPSWALVRNPANGREVVVRINDRGPFHADRIIDLSYAAAARLGVLRGVAPVELRRLTHDDIRSGRWRGDGAQGQTEAQAWPAAAATLPVDAAMGAKGATGATDAPAAPANPAAAARAPTPAAAGFWVQLGAFSQRQGAHELRDMLARDLAWLAPWLAIFDDRALYRLQAGPYATRSEAQGTAERVRNSAGVQPVVIHKR